MKLNRAALLLAAFTLASALMELTFPSSGLPTAEVVWTRYAVHLVALGILFVRRPQSLVHSVHPARQIVRSLLMLGMPLAFIGAAQRMPVYELLSVFWVSPLLLILMTFATRTSRVPAATIVATLVGLTGTLLILKPDSGTLRLSSILPLGMAICFSLYIFLTARMRDETAPSKLFHTALWVVLVLTFAAPLFWIPPTLHGILVVVAIGFIGLVALYLLDCAVVTVEPAVLAPVLYLQVVWQVFLRWMAYGGRPDRVALVGILVVCLAAIPTVFRSADSSGSLRRPSLENDGS